MAKFTVVNYYFKWAGNTIYGLYSTEQNDFEIERKEQSVLARDDFFHNNMT